LPVAQIVERLPGLLAILLSGAGDARVSAGALGRICELFEQRGQVRALDAVLKRMQVALGHRRMSIAIYDHAFHVLGGGQKYAATLAAALQDDFDVTYLVHEPADLARAGSFYGLDLSRCRTRTVALPFYAERSLIDSSAVTTEMQNPFDAVARASADYDVLVNANMLEKVRPLAPLSVFVCHFPDVLPRAHFAAHEYTFLIGSSRYGSGWVRRRWGLAPSLLLYPPVDVSAPQVAKEPIILSVARFEPGGSKKQLEMIEAFRALRAAAPDAVRGWRLVLVGGSSPRNAYLERVREAASREPGGIEVRVDVPFEELLGWYGRASLFWHACGLGERDPQLIEHFGMTTVEAMQNRCAPVVFDGGGQREILEHGTSGFRFRSLDELCALTVRLIEDAALRRAVQERGRARSKLFGRPAFETRVRWFFHLLRREYSTFPPPDHDVAVRVNSAIPAT
jgi:glycosyltransferase involved in cell wall biosynthesis